MRLSFSLASARSRSSSDRSLSRRRPPGDGSATGRSDDGDPLRRARDTQLCNVPGWMPRSSATSGIGFPVSVTIRTAPSRNPAS